MCEWVISRICKHGREHQSEIATRSFNSDDRFLFVEGDQRVNRIALVIRDNYRNSDEMQDYSYSSYMYNMLIYIYNIVYWWERKMYLERDFIFIMLVNAIKKILWLLKWIIYFLKILWESYWIEKLLGKNDSAQVSKNLETDLKIIWTTKIIIIIITDV